MFYTTIALLAEGLMLLLQVQELVAVQRQGSDLSAGLMCDWRHSLGDSSVESMTSDGYRTY